MILRPTPEEIFKDNRIIGAIYGAVTAVAGCVIFICEKLSLGHFGGLFEKVKRNGAIFNNVVGLTLFNALGGILLVVTQIKLANALGPSTYGVYAYCLAIGEVGTYIVRYGRNKTMLRDLVQRPDRCNSLISSTFCSSLLNLLLFIAVVLPLYKILDFPLTPGCVLLIISPCLISLDFQPVYESLMAMSWHSVYNLLQKTIFVSVIWVAIFFSFGLTLEFLGCVTFASWIIIIYGEFSEITRHYGINIRRDCSWNEIKELYRANFIIALCSAASVLYQPALRMVLNHYDGSAAVGIYSAGFQILLIAQFIITQIARVGNPMMAEVGKDDCPLGKRRKFLFNYFKIMVICSLPCVLPLLLFPDFITTTFFSDKYDALRHILPVFGVALLLHATALVFEQFLISMRKDKTYFSVFVLGGIVALVASLVLVPRISVLGAAVAVGCSWLTMLVGYCLSSLRVINCRVK